MLETLFFLPRPAGTSSKVLGVIASRAPATHSVSFSVPAHVFLTLNVVTHGTLMQGQSALPSSFATGAHTRSRRYQLSSGAMLFTLFCRADAALDLCQRAPAELADTWVSCEQVFQSWKLPAERSASLNVAPLMLDCVAPPRLPADSAVQLNAGVPRIQEAYDALAESDVPGAAKQLHMSERSLQRLFMSQWGIRPKLVQRLLRIQRCVRYWEDPGTLNRSLADLALHAGLSDQAHLAREFRQLVGYAPSSLKQPKQDKAHKQSDALWALHEGSRLLTQLMR